MLAEPLRTKVWEIADSYYPKHDWAHGRNHIERVLKMAIEIGKQERADLEILELATILHDIFQNREAHASIEGFRHETEGSKEARKILTKLGLADRTVDAVCHCIESHRKRSGRTEPQTIEAKCLFDADKLDCIGAIGTIRSAFVSFDHKQEFYKEVDDIELTDVETFDRTEQSSTLHCTRQTWNTNLASRRLRTECTQRQERGLRRRERRSWTHSTTGLERN